LDGLALRVKLGTTTVRLTEVLAVMLPEVPLIAIGYVPAGTAVVVAKVTVDEPAVVAKTALMPAGSVEVVKATVPIKPFCAETTRLVEIVPGRTTDRLGLPGATVKVGTVIVKASGAVLLSLPEVPVMVSG
jgi:hypothetical protein